jgi:hypothetical protein
MVNSTWRLCRMLNIEAIIDAAFWTVEGGLASTCDRSHHKVLESQILLSSSYG